MDALNWPLEDGVPPGRAGGTGDAVHFGDDFLPRLGRLVVRLALARERREGPGPAALAGGGEEFIGYRPYRPGEDLRQLDWSLFARLDRPYVRVLRRESSEAWSILVDTSASMGVGDPSKLALACEVAAACAALGLRVGARVRVALSGERPGGRPGELVLARRTDLPRLFAFLEGTRAAGAQGAAELCRRARVSFEPGRVILIGDLQDVEPDAFVSLARRRRELLGVQVLAPLELEPPRTGAVEWLDPEDGARVVLELDRDVLADYQRRLELSIEAFARMAARHGVRFVTTPSDRTFERVVLELFEGR
jgi:uncharacterized protein (DUF58 family)